MFLKSVNKRKKNGVKKLLFYIKKSEDYHSQIIASPSHEIFTWPQKCLGLKNMVLYPLKGLNWKEIFFIKNIIILVSYYVFYFKGYTFIP